MRLKQAAANPDILARQATSAGVVADAFGQKRREDRYTIHLRGDARKWRGDGTDATDDSAGDGRLAHLAPAVADWLDEPRPWRSVCGDDDSVLGRVEIKFRGTPRLDGVNSTGRFYAGHRPGRARRLAAGRLGAALAL